MFTSRVTEVNRVSGASDYVRLAFSFNIRHSVVAIFVANGEGHGYECA
jgi:hypothetical protein